MSPATESTSASPLRRVNALVYRAEEAMIALFLLATVVLMFIDVVDRRLTAQDSRLAVAVAKVLGITREETLAALTAWAPKVAAALGALVVVAAFRASERKRARPLLPGLGAASPYVAALLALGGVVGLGVAMQRLESKVFTLVLYGLAAGAYVVTTARARAPGWALRVGGVLGVVTPAFVWLALTYFPQGYTWSKEISLLFVLWVGLFGASVCAHEGKHLRLEALEKRVPERFFRPWRAASMAIAAGFCAFLAYLGYQYVFGPGDLGMYWKETTLAQTGFPTWVLYVAIPLAFGLTALRFLGGAVSAALGGDYAAPAKAEGMKEAEEAARARGETVDATGKARRPTVFVAVAAVAAALPLLGKGGVVASVVLVAALFAQPLFVLLGGLTVVCLMLWSESVELITFIPLVERMSSLADNQALLAIPLFIMAGGVMARGEISKKLIAFSQAIVGWLPGGLAISAVLACMIFAAISGSSPATVVAIGGMMAPALIQQGYREGFAHGLVTSAGSLGILIPPSIPMIVYAIVNTTESIRLERLFGGGFGPGMVIGGILMGASMLEGIRSKAPRQPFSFKEVWRASSEGIWALLFPVFVLGGIWAGFFNAVEAAACSVVYAVVVEVFLHRALRISDIPKVFQETGVLLGSFLVILVVATAFGEFLEGQHIPQAAAEWIDSLHLQPWQFLLAINVLLLIVGALMDIMSAIFVFVPLLAPMCAAMQIDPIHFGIIFIVNLEIGYLTPPIGLNLFVSSTLFGKPVSYITKNVLPFIGFMLVGLAVVTYWPALTLTGADLFGGKAATSGGGPRPAGGAGDDGTDDAAGTGGGGDDTGGGGAGGGAGGDRAGGGGAGDMPSLEEMMRQLDEQGGGAAPNGSVDAATGGEGAGGEAGGEGAGGEAGTRPASGGAEAPLRLPGRGVLTMEEMMQLADERARAATPAAQ
jgi:C4-dicarboxylate transporter DctM subunit